MTRKSITQELRREVLLEAGYRCAVPTCRTILATDLHHIIEVSDGGTNILSNLIALCPNCHALHHRGTIPAEAIRTWKLMLVALNNAFDKQAIDSLIFLSTLQLGQLYVSGDGVLHFSRLIAAGLSHFRIAMQNGPIINYEVSLTAKGHLIVDAWKAGNIESLQSALET